VDRSLTAKHGDIVIATVNGEHTIKKLETKPTLRLVSMNSNYAPIEIPEDTDIDIFGVATHTVHALQNL
jgi:DNA polymerase V